MFLGPFNQVPLLTSNGFKAWLIFLWLQLKRLSHRYNGSNFHQAYNMFDWRSGLETNVLFQNLIDFEGAGNGRSELRNQYEWDEVTVWNFWGSLNLPRLYSSRMSCLIVVDSVDQWSDMCDMVEILCDMPTSKCKLWCVGQRRLYRKWRSFCTWYYLKFECHPEVVVRSRLRLYL